MLRETHRHPEGGMYSPKTLVPVDQFLIFLIVGLIVAGVFLSV